MVLALVQWWDVPLGLDRRWSPVKTRFVKVYRIFLPHANVRRNATCQEQKTWQRVKAVLISKFYNLSAFIMITVDERNKYFDHNIAWHHKHYIFSSTIRRSIDYRTLACPSDLSVAIGLWRLIHLLNGRTYKFG